MEIFALLALFATCFQVALATIRYQADPFNALKRRETSWNSTVTAHILATSGPTVDLGYSVYQGAFDAIWNLNSFKGIRFAAPPTGQLRWQLPQPPNVNRSHVIQAIQLPSQCPQALRASGQSGADQARQNAGLGPSSEDCLFLNIYAPANATDLPVLICIHGGGYGYGNANQDLSSIITANDNGFIGVAIQYRLGAFGFLSSDQIDRSGVANAGLRDQMFALQWVQSYIHLFGGNASHVTIAGESAGAGSVMLQSMAFDGELGLSLFSNIIAASPYLISQYHYNDWVPSQAYYAFAESAGCFTGSALGDTLQHHSTVFECLVNAETSVLMNANEIVSASGPYGTWTFVPVTDGTFLKRTPSQQLLLNRINGARILSGNNANEGIDFVPQNLTTEADVVSWLQGSFPLLSNNDIAKVLLYYPPLVTTVTNATVVLTKLNDQAVQQKRANDIYSESVFVCPSYWLAEGFSSKNRKAFKYQYSVLPGLHGADYPGYFGPPVSYLSAQFMQYFQRIWGNFIMWNDPSILNGKLPIDPKTEALIAWPAFSDADPIQLSLNQTGGQLVTDRHTFPLVSYGKFLNSTYYIDPGLRPTFSLVNAYTFEGGRGSRCDFWRAIGNSIPE